MVDVICPLLKRRYAQAMCHTNCAAMRTHIEAFFDKKYQGDVYANHQSRCQGVGGQVVNFAVLYALSSPRAMFNMTYCPAVSESDCPEGTEPIPDYHKLKTQAKAVNAAGSAADEDKDEDMVDVAKAEAEAKARAEANMYKYDALTGQKCCAACGGCPKCVMCSVGTVIVPENPNGGDDTYNNKNVHNVVSDDEAGGVNKPRGPTTLKPAGPSWVGEQAKAAAK